MSAEAQPSTRTMLQRLHTIAFMLRAGKKFTASEFARSYEVSRKTIMRDIDLLACIGYEVEWDGSGGTYRLGRAPAPAL